MACLTVSMVPRNSPFPPVSVKYRPEIPRPLYVRGGSSGKSDVEVNASLTRQYREDLDADAALSAPPVQGDINHLAMPSNGSERLH
jgi:hypothetical protein